MKFRFCGDGDCPDWVLAEIISTLSNLNAAKLEKLVFMVSNKIIGHSFEEENIKLIAADVADDGKSAVACIDFILVNAARYNIDSSILLEELQQLGLPKLHAIAICRVLTQTETLIRKKLIENSFKVNELESVSFNLGSNTIDSVLLHLNISNLLVNGLPNQVKHSVSIDRANLSTLLKDMEEARRIMQKYTQNNDC